MEERQRLICPFKFLDINYHGDDIYCIGERCRRFWDGNCWEQFIDD